MSLSRNLATEHIALSVRFKEAGKDDQKRAEVADEYAKLFIDTLKDEKVRTKWTDIARRFPISICIYAMTNGVHKKKFQKRLGIKALSVHCWVNKLKMEALTKRMRGGLTDQSRKIAEEEFNACKERCVELMKQLVKENKPQTIPELRDVLDSAYDYETQSLFIQSLRTILQEMKLPLLSKKDDFLAFRTGFLASLLHDRFVTGPSLKTSKAYHDHMKQASAKLAVAIFQKGSLDDKFLENHHPLVQNYLAGQRQPLLYEKLNAEISLKQFAEAWETEVSGSPKLDAVVQRKVPLSDLRAWASDLKLELDPETDVTRLVQLFKGLRRVAIRRQCIQKKRQDWRRRNGVIATKKRIAPKTLWLKVTSRIWLRELPLRIIHAVTLGGAVNLDTRLVDTLHQLPIRVVRNTLQMFKEDIIATTEEESLSAVIGAIKFFEKAYV